MAAREGDFDLIGVDRRAREARIGHVVSRFAPARPEPTRPVLVGPR